MTVPEAFDDGVRRFPHQQVRWVDDSHRVERTFEKLGESVRRTAAGLRALGLRPGSAIVSQLPNRVEGLVIFHAAIRAGLVFVPVLPTHGPADVARAIRATNAAAYVGVDLPDATTWRRQQSEFETGGSITHLIGVGPTAAGVTAWADVAAGDDAGLPGLDPDAPCAFVLTSGSTGHPKAVIHTHRSLLARASPGIPGADGGEHIELSVLPSGHIGGIVRTVRTFAVGIPMVYLQRWSPDAALDVIERERITTMGLTPFFLVGLIERQRDQPRDTSSLRHVLVGGANVRPEDVRAADALGWRVVRSYGSTEHPMSFVSHVDDPLEARATTDGRATCGASARIVGPEGSLTKVGQVGEVQVRGPAQCAGYLDASATATAFTPDGWFKTGDLGRLDASGSLTITGRLKDIIIRGGENISAAEVEDILLREPRVLQAAVVGYPDERYGERACAFLVVEPGESFGLDEVRAHFRDSGIDPRKTPERIIAVDQLPRTEAGKVAKEVLRARASADATAPTAREGAR